MKCPKCNGSGDIPRPNGTKLFGLTEVMTCDLCNGTGEVEMSNEEWFCQLSTEEKAKVLRRKTYGNGEENEREEQGWVNWLKATHEDNPPDIPSVPSWDRWLQGEKTKCELCDGSGEWVECNLVGRFECPKTPKTEQEYLQTCDTEQLAEWFTNSGFLPCGLRECDDCKYYDKNNDDCDFNFYGSINHKKMWLEWLKQPHSEEQ